MKIKRLDFPTIDSTNFEARRRWNSPLLREEAAAALRDGRRPAWVFVAREQTAGRGRLGRIWKSPRGGLWFSVLWPFTVDSSRMEGISLAIGLAVAEAIECIVCVDCKLKWPNDLLLGDRKLAGILCELESRPDGTALIIGIGINANLSLADFGIATDYGATTLLDEIGQEVNLEQLLEAVLDRLFERVVAFESQGFSQIREELHERLAWRGQEVVLSGSEIGSITGTLLGVDETGRLLLISSDGTRAFLTGELRRVPTKPPSA